MFHVNFAKFLGKNFLKKPLRLLVLKILVLKTLTNCFCNNKPLNIVNYCYKALPHELLSLIFHRKNFISKKPVINQAISLTTLLNSVQEFIEIEIIITFTCSCNSFTSSMYSFTFFIYFFSCMICAFAN